jgi:hypothetical protein
MTSHQREAELPDLKIVPVADLLLHEQHDSQRSAPLAARLAAEGMLKNPPIVAPINGDNRYVVLDGANRVTALDTLGVPHIIVQSIDYENPDLVLDTWYHLVSGFPRVEFSQAIRDLEGVDLEPTDLTHARAELARREALAYIVYPDDGVFTMCADGDLHQRAKYLNEIVDIYKSRGRIYRANTDRVDQLTPYYDNVTVLVVFPRYQPAEIIELARFGARLPAGITRHVIPHRALRINFPLAVLQSDQSLAEKNVWLNNWLKEKIAHKEVRFYQESTVLFDE